MGKVIDFYLKHPTWLDGFLICILFTVNHYIPVIFTIKYDSEAQLDVLASLIGTSVSLAGFILAALTIIVAFKSNIACKPASEANSPLELLFSTKQYPKIIKVFKDAIIELTIVFVGLYVVWIMLDNLTSSMLLTSNIYGSLLVFLTVFRTLFVLFLILDLDSANENTE